MKKQIIFGIAVLLICVGLSGCEEQKETVKIKTENMAPTIQMFNAYPTSGIAPLNVSFMGYALDLDGGIVSYIWDFDDGEYSIEENPKHTFQTSGTYTVTLNVRDDDGATYSKSIEIIVEEKQNSGIEIVGEWITQHSTAPQSKYIFYGNGNLEIISEEWTIQYNWYMEDTIYLYIYDEDGIGKYLCELIELPNRNDILNLHLVYTSTGYGYSFSLERIS